MSESLGVCRGCLSSDSDMRNMFDLNIHEDFSSFTNIQVYRCEGLSELLCAGCRSCLAACRAFRSRCRQSDGALRKQMYSTEIQDNSAEDLSGVKLNLQREEIKSILDSDKLTFHITPKDFNSDTDGNLACPYKCNSVFTKKNHLLSHLTKLHGINKDTFTINTQYYCSHKNCKYNLGSRAGKFFPLRRTLRNHIKNVHLVERVDCEFCKMKFPNKTAFERHKAECGMKFVCASCSLEYQTHERLMVHLMRRHPYLHREYKRQRREGKVKKRSEKSNAKRARENFESDSPRRNFATQTKIVNDITLNSCSHGNVRSFSTSNETQTMFEDLLRSEDEFETISLSDIQTQTWPVKKSNETQTNNFTSPDSSDLSFKQTQTCFCFTDSPRPSASHFNFPRYLFESVNSSPNNLTSTETQTADACSRDVLLSFNSIETQTCEDCEMDEIKLNI